MPGFGASPHYFRRQIFGSVPEVPQVDLSGHCILITGATSGLGYECAKQLLQRKCAHLILPVRSLERGEKAKERLLAETHATTNPRIDLYEYDQASYASITAFTEKLKGELGGRLIDVAILNAGLNKLKKTLTADNTELTLQVNHLSTALLSLLLIPLLRTRAQGKPGRITIVASETHWWTAFDQGKADNVLDEIDHVPENKYDVSEQYNASKLLNVFWGRELAKRYPDIVVNIVNPGFVKTNLGRDFPAPLRAVLSIMLFVMGRAPDVGARNLTYAAVVADDNTSGVFLSECAEFEVSPLVRSAEGARLQEKVWEETVARLSSVAPEITKIVK